MALNDTLLDLYEGMLRIRGFESEILKRGLQGENLAIHPYTGQEAIAVGVMAHLSKEDLIVSNHRPWGHFIAKGGSLNKAMAELYGKESGICKGLGGEMNISDPSIGFVQSTMIVGAPLTLACGVALALKQRKLDNIAVVFFGEGASSNGAFNEALIMAKVFKLPLLFICENNGYSTNTPSKDYLPTDLVIHRAIGYGFPTDICDGTDVIPVWEAANKAVRYVREARQPYFLECLTVRMQRHKIPKLSELRSPETLQLARMRDPIPKLRTALLNEGLLTAQEDALISQRIEKEVQSAVSFAKGADM